LWLEGDFESQLALYSSSAGQATDLRAGVVVRALRHVPGSTESQWITNGELLFPGFRLDEKAAEGIRLVLSIEGLRGQVEIVATDEQIYYVRSICSDGDSVCIEFADEIYEISDYR
jgi:hypothetical protein